MPYIFPKRLVRGDQMPDPKDFDRDFIPAAEKISGRLNAHDLSGSSLKAGATVGSNAYYKPYYNEVQSDPGWGDDSLYAHPTVGGLPANTDLLVPNAGWTALSSIGHSSVSIGNGNLWIVGWAQYVYHSFVTTAPGHTSLVASSPDPDSLRIAGIQFAIRVDGQIVPESVTGHTIDWRRFIQPLKPQTQRDSTSATNKKRNPGPGLHESSPIRGIGPQAMPVRVTCSVPVLEGTHTVEMVARVVAKDNPILFSAVSLQVGVHNRKLFVLGCPTVPASAPTRTATTVPNLNAGSTISAQTFYTDRADKIADAYNDISEGDLSRGALMNAHLPPSYLDQSYTQILPSSDQTIDCLYPGYGDATVAGAKASGNAGWWPLDDGAGPAVFLRTDNDSSRTPGTDVDVTTTNTWVIVMANVQLRAVKDNTNPRRVDELAAFTIMHRNDTAGTYTNTASSECYVNRYINWGDIGGNAAELDIEVDVPLFHVYNYSSSVPSNNFDHIGVYGCGMALNSGGTPASPDVIYRRGSLTMIQLRA